MPLVSIVIPCYNSGQFLLDALQSVSDYSDKSVYEVVIVNDGSTDKVTLDLLSQLSEDGYVVIHQENKGPAAARNTGVHYVKGEYLLFLDSDNKIRTKYIDKGIEMLTSRLNVGVVHANPVFFGDTSNYRFVSGEFNMVKILSGNYIDMCSIVRRSAWEEVGGFDENRVLIGHEDWELWIRIGAKGWKFAHINEELFEYRVRADSLTTQVSIEEKLDKMLSYVHGKHWRIFQSNYNYLNRQLEYYRQDQANPIRSFIKFLRGKYITHRDSESDESAYL